jgi:repressor LexA
MEHRSPLLLAMHPPTPRQQQVLGFITQSQHNGDGMPSIRKIAAHLGLKGTSAAHLHVEALKRKGLLGMAGMSPGTDKKIPGIPLLGVIPAGFADQRTQEPDGLIHVDVEALKIPKSSRTFALKVTGDSMIGKCIMDGDVVIMEQNADPKPGDVVAALIDGQSTLKTYLLDRGRPYLRAENPRFPNLIPLDELMIQGVMRMLVRTPVKKK